MEANKQRLMELANLQLINTLKEAVDPNFEVKLEVKVKAGYLIEMFGGAENLGDTVTDPNKFQAFTRKIQEDLSNWLAGPGGDEWANDGVESGEYDEFVPY
jgi:hypothetical protein